ncbi:recombinational DNA repair protein (RecE pathway) [Christiangramia fulva]|uniref:Recombinational DNA repair protein (RecE pathway) n=1 Tax=Christiangramia fulva TaxID=2126553 RepID=A0A2R3ZAH8_9FLAO|nr:recombinase RecT [Christiangramia fulva]AVR47224.1 recombinational DNA repair protein (RecE pathway) [Christiangramia fulva]
MNTKTEEKKKNELAKQQPSHSERFTMAVQREMPKMGEENVQLTNRQKKLIQNYFIKIDGVLKDSEVKRLAKSENYRDPLEYSWANINMNKLAQDVVAYSSIGLDPLQNNHIHPIPYKNSKTNQFDITFIEGYNGLELKAKKYGFDAPDTVIFELKYSTDHFKSLKKNLNNKVESYEFEITNDFDRGELEGGFYYMIYNDNPEKNKLVVMNRHQIEKRRPEYAAAEFWGGEKDNWEYDQAKGKNVKKGKKQVEGWEEEMFLKTLKRHCWNSIPIDSQKIDDFIMKVIENETQGVERLVKDQITESANKKEIDFDDVDYEEVKEASQERSSENDDAEMERLHEEAIAEEENKKAKAEPDF